MIFTTENLNVGDKVIMNSMHNSFVGTIIKKTPSGLIDVVFGQSEPERFKVNGEKQGTHDLWNRQWLSYWTQDIEDEIKNRNRKRELSQFLSRFNFNFLGLSELEQIYKIARRENVL